MKKSISLQKAAQRKYMALTLTLVLVTLGIVAFFFVIGQIQFSTSFEDFVIRQTATVLGYHDEHTAELEENESRFLAVLLRKIAEKREISPAKPFSELLLEGVERFSPETLRSLSGKELHLHQISAKGIITNSTFSREIGLDLSSYPKFWQTLTSLQKEQILIEDPVPSTRRGELTWYAYLKQKNGSFLELGLSAKDYSINGMLGMLEDLPLVSRVSLYHYPTLLAARTDTPPLKETDILFLRPLLEKKEKVLRLKRGFFPRELFFLWEKEEASGIADIHLEGEWLVHLHLDILWIQGAFHFFLFALCGALLLAGFLFSLRGEKLTRSINEPIEDLLKRMEMLSENAASPALEKILLEAAPPSHLREIRQLSRGFEKMTLQIASAFQKQEKALQKEQEMAQRLNSILNTTVELTEAISSGSGDLFDTALKNAISLVPEAEHGAITAIEKNLCQFRAAHYAEKTPRLQSLLFPHSRENATSSEILRGKNYMETLSPSFNEVIREKLAKQMPASRDTLVKPLFFGTQCAGELILSIPEGSPHAAFSSESLRSAEAIGNGFAAFLGLEKFIKSQELFQKELFLAFAGILETHDSYTQGHSESVALLGAQTAKALGLQEKEVQKTYWAGLVHDIGKILIPREILNKPGALSSEEYELIKQHPALGHSVLTKTQRLEEVAPFVLHHHERWDGAGYPEGLRREGIPHIARILAVADAWDAMTSNRAYRQALSRETARQEILLGKETQFDPQVVDAFLPLIETPLL